MISGVSPTPWRRDIPRGTAGRRATSSLGRPPPEGPMRILLPLLAVVACADGAETHARVRFVDGRTLEGDIVARDETRISLATGGRADDGGLARAVIACPLDRVESIEELPTPADEYRARAGAAVSADDHAALAAWCRANGLEAHAAEHAQRALALDPGQAVAKRELG